VIGLSPNEPVKFSTIVMLRRGRFVGEEPCYG
jgi:hypothetical protein